MFCDDDDDGRSFDYLFYIDFEASMAEIRAQHALGHLQVSFPSNSRALTAPLKSITDSNDRVFWFCRNSPVSSVYSGVIPWI